MHNSIVKVTEIPPPPRWLATTAVINSVLGVDSGHCFPKTHIARFLLR